MDERLEIVEGDEGRLFAAERYAQVRAPLRPSARLHNPMEGAERGAPALRTP